MSGQLVTQIQSAAGVLSLNGVTGLLTLGGVNGNAISVSGTTLWISGSSGYAAAVYATIANLASTGQQAWTAANANGTNLSGVVASTGQQAWLAAQTNATNLSGNLTATGALLSAVKVTGSNILQQINLTGMGGTLIIQSGNFVLISGATSAGGGGVTQGQLDSLSGWSASAVNLFATGSTLVQLNLTTSGALVSLITAAAVGVSTLNGLSGVLTLGAAGGNLFVTPSGQTIFVSGSGIAQASDLVATGGLLIARDTNISGGLEARIFATGTAGVTYGNATFATIGNLASTGQQAWLAAQNNAFNLSGNLTQTGVNLGATIASVSGGVAASVFATGAAAVTYGNNTFATLTNLTLTGQTDRNNALNLSGTIASTGQQAWLAASNNGINLSGTLFTTGALLSAVKVTGSTLIQVPNFSGIGGTQVILSGSFVLISGSAGGSSAAVDHGDGINLSGQLTLTGQTLLASIAALSGYIIQPPLQNITTPINTGAVTVPAALNIDFSGSPLQTVTITGAVLISGINYAAGRSVTVRMFTTGTSKGLTWAPWNFLTNTAPTGLATGKAFILAVQSFHTTDTGVYAAYALQVS